MMQPISARLDVLSAPQYEAISFNSELESILRCARQEGLFFSYRSVSKMIFDCGKTDSSKRKRGRL